MDTKSTYRFLVERILGEHTRIPYSNEDIQLQIVFDRERDHYLVMLVGREGVRHVHGCLIHVDIIGDKLWIHRDGTEYGVAQELLDAGVPKSSIVLAFYSPEKRRLTDFAVA